MARPLLVIVGRPNVGKSTLFNRIVGRPAAIVEDIPGVTRDRNYMDAEWNDKAFIAADTGGFYPEAGHEIFGQIKEQALFAIEEADLVIHLLDAKEGLNPIDKELARLLRASGKKVIWAANKIDAPTREDRLIEFYALGAEDLIPVSAITGYNFDALMDRAAEFLPAWVEEPTVYPKIAVIGRPNVGKSTLVNSLLGKRRMLVSAMPGTTRDAVDSICSYYRKKYLLIDTAGIRRKDRTGYSIERFAMLRAMRSIERADVALVMLDASAGIVAEDQKIAGMVERNGKGAVFVFNKWDLMEDPEADRKRLVSELKRKLWFFAHAPVITASGLERKRITGIFPLIDGVIAERKKRIPTSELNRFLRELPMPTSRGRKIRLNYMSQVGTEPPRFVIFTNAPDAFNAPRIKHIEGLLREKYSFGGTPIRIEMRGK